MDKKRLEIFKDQMESLGLWLSNYGMDIDYKVEEDGNVVEVGIIDNHAPEGAEELELRLVWDEANNEFGFNTYEDVLDEFNEENMWRILFLDARYGK